METERYRRTFGMKLYVRGWTAAHKVIRPRLGVSGYAFGNRFIALERPNGPPAIDDQPTAYILRNVPSFDERVDAFWEEASRPFDFAIDRTYQYLPWRFDPRAGRFTITLAEDDGRPLGYAVTSSSRGRGYIADLIALPDRLDVARDLVSSALDSFGRTDLTAVECWLPTRHPYRVMLQELGFARSERKLRFRYTPVGLTREQLEPLRRLDAPLHLTASDTDLV